MGKVPLKIKHSGSLLGLTKEAGWGLPGRGQVTLSSWPPSGGGAEETGQIKPGGWAHGSLNSSEEKPAGSSHSKCGVTDLAVGSPGESEVGEVPQGCSRALQSMSKDLKYRHSSGISQKPGGNYCFVLTCLTYMCKLMYGCFRNTISVYPVSWCLLQIFVC